MSPLRHSQSVSLNADSKSEINLTSRRSLRCRARSRLHHRRAAGVENREVARARSSPKRRSRMRHRRCRTHPRRTVKSASLEGWARISRNRPDQSRSRAHKALPPLPTRRSPAVAACLHESHAPENPSGTPTSATAINRPRKPNRRRRRGIGGVRSMRSIITSRSFRTSQPEYNGQFERFVARFVSLFR